MFGKKYKNHVPSRVRKKYSEGELKIFDNIDVNKPRSGWGILRYAVIVGIVVGIGCYGGFELSQYSKSYFGWGGVDNTVSDEQPAAGVSRAPMQSESLQ